MRASTCWLLLLTSLLAASCKADAGTDDVVLVTTALELQTAVSAKTGPAHVHVTEHLDLSELKRTTFTGSADYYGNYEDNFDYDTAQLTEPILVVAPRVRSITSPGVQGSCGAKHQNGGPKGACELKLQWDRGAFPDIMYVGPEQGSAAPLWLHGLDFRGSGSKPIESGIFMHDAAQLWITNVTLRGTDFGLYLPGKARVLVADSTMRDSQSDGAVLEANAAASFIRCAFNNNGIMEDDDFAKGGGIDATEDSQVRLEACTFEENVFYDVSIGSRSKVYTDAQSRDVEFNGVGEPQPLGAASARNFLQPDDEAFLRIRLAVHDALDEELHRADGFPRAEPRSVTGGNVVEFSSVFELPEASAPQPASDNMNRPSNKDDGEGGTKVGLIAGVTVGAVVLVAVAALIAARTQRRKRISRKQKLAVHESELSDSVEGTAQDPGSPPRPLQLLAAPLSGQAGRHPLSASSSARQSATPPGRLARAVSDSSGGAAMHTSTFDTLGATTNLHARITVRSNPSGGDSLHAASHIPSSTSATKGSYGTLNAKVTSAQEADLTPLEVLEHTLNVVGDSEELFAGRYKLLGTMDRRLGGQGVVQFATLPGHKGEYAIKFFFDPDAYHAELALYNNATLRAVMPSMYEHCENADGALCASDGRPWPPHLITERGESLDEFAQRQDREPITNIHALTMVTERVKELHAAGIVHRDLKPGNILRMPLEHSWALIDFGCAAKDGEVAQLALSLAYAPPEVASAYSAGEHTIVATTQMDVWSLGVLAYELLTREQAFPFGTTRDAALAALRGDTPLCWEAAGQEELRRLLRLRGPVLQCLSRNPAKRPTVAELALALNNMFKAETTMAGTQGRA